MINDNEVIIYEVQWHFRESIKFYREDNQVNVSFKVSDTCTMVKHFTVDEFDYICNNWREGVDGYETEDSGRVWWEYRTHGPRPECKPMKFVAISLAGWNFRIWPDEMEKVELLWKNSKNN